MLHKTHGFTFLEVLIAVAIIAVVAALVFVSFNRSNQVSALSGSTEVIVSVIQEARTLTLASKAASQYGVHFSVDEVVLFKGATYSTSDPENRTTRIHPLVRISVITLSGGGTDVVFKRLTGGTDQNGTITLELASDPSRQEMVTVTITGIVEVQ